MAPLGPFEPAPLLAVAVSGGADSLALALLARDWARARGGMVTGLVVDHALRPESGAEAALTLQRLAGLGIAARLIVLQGLAHGPALAARARAARHAALTEAAAGLGIVHLLMGHHAGDQAETVAMRRLAGSGPAGLAGMAALVEGRSLRLLRPLLPVPPGRLRATLRAAGLDWVEDPSNRNPAALRARLRLARGDADGAGVLTRAAGEAAAARGAARAAVDHEVAAELAARVRLHPGGYAMVAPGPLSPPALGALLRVIAGAAHAPPPAQVAALAVALRPATLAGVRVMPAGRLGPGWLLLREAAAMAAPVLARPGAVWDGRFRLADGAALPEAAWFGAVGDDAARLRHLKAAQHLPAALLRTLPALRLHGELFVVPHLGYAGPVSCHLTIILHAVESPIAGAPFLPSAGLCPKGVQARVGM
ncbi:tRNA lysidine(34) synthetase TilS [Rhodovastum atsumiense]|uniref:tRNA(Ile)-lysidine synthase n=2 Tax=Rhodovastum atsumiense TaxID=504468 RepID=A0A5M6IJK8_9PROT|nr:tRNA lysidine(34) synthetase TilS [Rhodovastum atsumiense]